MIQRSLSELTPYEASGYFRTKLMRIHGEVETGAEKFWVSLATFLPGGGAEYTYEKSPSEKFYYVIDGEINIFNKSGSKFVLHTGETISIKPYEGRALRNTSDKPATILIVTNYPD